MTFQNGVYKRILFFSLVLMVISGSLFCTVQNALAQDYRFSIPRNEIIFWVEPDGTVSISYDFSISNLGKPLDYIDIGAPNNNFSLSNVIAEVDGVPVDSKKISYVDYKETGIPSGVTIDYTGSPIPLNTTAPVYLEIQGIANVLYLSSEKKNDEEYVSFQFMPSHFSADFTRGTTDLSIRLVLPAGIGADEAVFFKPKKWPGNAEPESWITKDGNVVYEWHSSEANSYSPYIFGAMFPKKYMNAGVAIETEAQAASQSSGSSSSSNLKRLISGILRKSWFWFAIVIFFLFKVFPNSSKQKKAGVSYLPPKIKAEGEGIKRGLTAIEAAVLLEEKMDKIISMIIFSLVKKGAIRVVEQNPFKIETESPLPDGLMDYETAFIEAVNTGKNRGKVSKMQKTISALVLSVTDKMKGFNLEETKTYYRNIISKAWDQVKAADTPELKGEKLDEIFGWAMLDEDVSGRTQETFGDSPVFLPPWWWRMGPSYPRPVSASPIGSPSTTPVGIPAPSQPTAMPTLPGADFARSITDSVRNFSQGTVGEIKAFTGLVSRTTNPQHSGSSNRSSGSGRSGGMSCACACACAGCACACAGGGGGR